uniref:Hedgehog/Intein (Hint) domain-containing protein n=1 Tax=viral metagenome TaxID=1070528 RepID=A0A6C0KSL4_9ZZZZ
MFYNADCTNPNSRWTNLSNDTSKTGLGEENWRSVSLAVDSNNNIYGLICSSDSETGIPVNGYYVYYNANLTTTSSWTNLSNDTGNTGLGNEVWSSVSLVVDSNNNVYGLICTFDANVYYNANLTTTSPWTNLSNDTGNTGLGDIYWSSVSLAVDSNNNVYGLICSYIPDFGILGNMYYNANLTTTSPWTNLSNDTGKTGLGNENWTSVSLAVDSNNNIYGLICSSDYYSALAGNVYYNANLTTTSPWTNLSNDTGKTGLGNEDWTSVSLAVDSNNNVYGLICTYEANVYYNSNLTTTSPWLTIPLTASNFWTSSLTVDTNSNVYGLIGTTNGIQFLFSDIINNPCFLSETQILTENNVYKKVKDITPNDKIISPFSTVPQKIKNIIKKETQNKSGTNMPLVIKASTLNEELPLHDVYLSGHHRVIISNGKNSYLGVQAFKLFNTFLTIEEAKDLTGEKELHYYHIELENSCQHLIASGLPVESYQSS